VECIHTGGFKTASEMEKVPSVENVYAMAVFGNSFIMSSMRCFML
jgi:hypothetical protein